jgi:hypothetical protein
MYPCLGVKRGLVTQLTRRSQLPESTTVALRDHLCDERTKSKVAKLMSRRTEDIGPLWWGTIEGPVSSQERTTVGKNAVSKYEDASTMQWWNATLHDEQASTPQSSFITRYMLGRGNFADRTDSASSPAYPSRLGVSSYMPEEIPARYIAAPYLHVRTTHQSSGCTYTCGAKVKLHQASLSCLSTASATRLA